MPMIAMIAMKITHYSVPLVDETMEELKRTVKQGNAKDALTAAVEFTIKNFKGKKG